MPGTLTSPYTDNKNTPAPASDVGLKISKPGFDARTTAGNNMTFDSSWPSLPIAFETVINNPFTGGATLATIPHNLQFPPFCMVWYYYNDASGINNVAGRFIPYSNRTNVYIYGNTSPFLSNPSITKLKIRAFQLDLSKDIDYKLAPGDTFNMPYDNNYGFKAAKQGKDITSRDMRDFTMHSRCQSPLVLAVKTDQTSTTANVVQYTSQLAYPVWVYGFMKMGATGSSGIGVPLNTYQFAPYYSQAYPKTFTDGFKSYLNWTSGVNGDNGATLVILRDPMFASTQKTVQY